jgi:hypothetical protein
MDMSIEIEKKNVETSKYLKPAIGVDDDNNNNRIAGRICYAHNMQG